MSNTKMNAAIRKGMGAKAQSIEVTLSEKLIRQIEGVADDYSAEQISESAMKCLEKHWRLIPTGTGGNNDE